MHKILNLAKLNHILEKIKKNKQLIVLTGGCFDILHIGHIKFIKEAKKGGDKLFVLLESDKKVKNLKGDKRPIFKQKERAIMLSAISDIDYVVKLPFMKSDEDYNRLVLRIKPDIIAVTENDPYLAKKKKQANLVGGKIKIIPMVKTFSSSRLTKILNLQ